MQAEHAIERGIAAAQANKQRTAYYYFYSATQADPTNEQAWLWRASAAPQPRDALFCLAAVLALNPENPVALHGVEQISAAVAAESTRETATITPSLSPGEFKPPEPKLAWQPAFQRELYDMGRVSHMTPTAAEDGAGDAREVAALADHGGTAYRRPAQRAWAQIGSGIRRIFVDRDTQRMQFAIPIIVVVLLLMGTVAYLGLRDVGKPPPSLSAGGGSTPSTVAALPATAKSSSPTAVSGVISTPPTTIPPSSPTVAPTAPSSPTAAPPTAPAPTAVPPTHPPTAVPPTQPPTAVPPTTVPSPTTRPAPPTASPPTQVPTQVPTQTPSGPATVSLAAGQSLQELAQQQGVTLAALMAYNGVTNPRDVGTGQTLKIPPKDYAPRELKYTLRYGDNLTNIANLFGTTVNAITVRNNLDNPSRIYGGQEITIPLP